MTSASPKAMKSCSSQLSRVDRMEVGDMQATLILPDWLIISARESPRSGWGVRVRGSQIDDVATHEDLKRRYPEDDIWEAPKQVLSPGFINTHTHMYGLLAHGIPLENAPSGFWSFLKDFWWPRVEDMLDHAMIRAATDWQCSMMLRSGVTSFYDCLEAPNALPGCLQVASEVVHKNGLRAILSFEATERISLENGQQGLKENADFIESSRKRGGLVNGMMCFHTSFTCSAHFICRAFELAGQLGTSVHLHCSEGTYEPEYALKHFGMRPIQYYDSLGVLGPKMLLSQCVQVDAEEIRLLALRGARVSHQPLSNCEVGGGIAPIPELLDAGIPVGLGSDSYIDDFFAIMRGAFMIQKARLQDPGVMPAHLVWHMATEGGAEVLGLEGIGRIEKGWQADLQLIDAVFPTPAKKWNLFDQLILYRNHTHVRAVMVAGVVRYRNVSPIDSTDDKLRAQTHEAAERLWAKSHRG